MAIWIQPAALLIVVLYVVMQSRHEPQPMRFVWRLGLLSVAGWLAEESCIRWYGFYDYAPGWWAKAGHLPLLVLLIWPVVIDSAGRMAGSLAAGRRLSRVALLAGFLVLADAALIEPVAVNAGLWQWTEPGLFSVPPVGIFGWACFGGLAVFSMGATRKRRWCWDLLVWPVTFVGTHLMLLASWWGCLRWVNVPIDDRLAAGLALMVAVVAVAVVIRLKPGARLPVRELLLRVPAALYFVALLIAGWPGWGALFWYFMAFNPPHIVLTLQAGSNPRRAEEDNHD